MFVDKLTKSGVAFDIHDRRLDISTAIDGDIVVVQDGSLIPSSLDVGYTRVNANAPVNWNTDVYTGSISPSFALPTVSGTRSREIRYTWTAASATASFTAPSGYILGNDDGFSGLSAGNTLVLSDLTPGSIYEVSFSVIDASHIGLVMHEWTTA